MKYQFDKTLFLILISTTSPALASTGTSWPSPLVIQKNNQVAESMKAGEFGDAQNKLLEGLAEDPFLAALHLNLGVSFYNSQKYEDAMKSYLEGLKYATDDQTKFMANYNLAELAQRAKKIDEALSWYQKALEFKPDSVEAKTNIELLIQQQQQQQKSGQGENQQQDQNQDKKDQNQKDNQNNKDQKDQNKNQDNKDDSKDEKQNESKDPKDKENKKYAKNKPQPKPFDSKELTPADAKKILDELKRQEQKIRTEFQRKEAKEQPKDKDW